MDLFQASQTDKPQEGVPLAERLRPRELADIVGQDSVIGEGSSLRKEIEAGRLSSLLIWGPPGSGKTTFALALSEKIQAEFIPCHAVESGAKSLREVGERGRLNRLHYSKRTVVFIDEIHRLNKAQQDVLLPFVEKGEIILVGATTENPSFEINSALLSRCRLIRFQRLAENQLVILFERACALHGRKPEEIVTPEGKDLLLGIADGDGRRLMNLTEMLIFDVVGKGTEGAPAIRPPVGPEEMKKIFSGTPLYHDKRGDAHYDTISAFIKCLRGSDADAGLYYLARLLEAGEDPVFIARRLVILASEDIGNADPRALTVAVATAHAVQLIGLPEAAINLAQAVTYLATAPKSNRSYLGLRAAQDEVRRTGTRPVPMHLRNAPTELLRDMGHGRGYRYSHDFEKGWTDQEYLPEGLKAKVFYEPIDRGYEKNIRQYIEWLKAKKPTS